MQLSFLKADLGSVVNVSKVAQLSPFRYPGGKTWLVPTIRHWLFRIGYKPKLLIEPFAGGGIVSLTAALENLADEILMVELDDQIASVWHTVLGRNAKWLAAKISSFDLSYKSAADIIQSRPRSLRQKAFQTILKNRIFHGGILAEGSGMLKNGENGRGILSRWYPETLKNRILRIHSLRRKIKFNEGDGITAIERFANKAETIFFVDPPYTAGGKKAGKRLYRYNEIDHDLLFRKIKMIKGDFMLTYDDSDEVRHLADKYNFPYVRVAMQNTHHAKMYELLICSNLKWL